MGVAKQNIRSAVENWYDRSVLNVVLWPSNLSFDHELCLAGKYQLLTNMVGIEFPWRPKMFTGSLIEFMNPLIKHLALTLNGSSLLQNFW